VLVARRRLGGAQQDPASGLRGRCRAPGKIEKSLTFSVIVPLSAIHHGQSTALS
jgi:hypothetical protein